GGGSLNASTQDLTPGLYKWNSAVTVTDSITLTGDANAVWVFQVTGTLDFSSAATMLLEGGVNIGNIFWQTAGTATLGTTSSFSGNLLSQTNIVVQTGATVEGRLLAQTAVTLDNNDVTAVPEPSTYAAILGLTALASVIVRRRTRRSV